MRRSIELEDVLRASDMEVESLLHEGDVQERVWAAWVLGLRRPEASTNLLERRLAEDIDPGVRRHLLVVLAGAGRRDLVARQAATDRDADVRATAVRLIARLAEPDDAAAYDLICARAIDIAWQVRHAVADSIRADVLAISPAEQAPHQRIVLERLVGMAFDPDPDVRAVVRARIDRGDLPSTATREIVATLDRLRTSRTRPDPESGSRTRALVRWRAPLSPV